MRHSIHQLRKGVTFHLFTNPDLAIEPRGHLESTPGRRISIKDKDLALKRLQRATQVRKYLLDLERGAEMGAIKKTFGRFYLFPHMGKAGGQLLLTAEIVTDDIPTPDQSNMALSLTDAIHALLRKYNTELAAQQGFSLISHILQQELKAVAADPEHPIRRRLS